MPDPMWHAPAGDEDCLFLILFDGPFGLTAVERPSDARALDVTPLERPAGGERSDASS